MSDFEQLADLLSRHREAAPLAALNLAAGDVAVVAGAYQGETMAFLRTIYGPELRLIGYEPQAWAYEILRERFADDGNVTVRPYGLGAEDGRFPMSLFGTDGATFLETADAAGEGGEGELREAVGALKAEGLKGMDLLVLNLEGQEYELLRHLHLHTWLHFTRYLLVQFHHAERMPYSEIRELLGRSHQLMWDNGPSWVCWRRWEA